MHRTAWALALGLALAGCNAPAPPAAQATDAQQGLVVVDTDYQSSNVELLGADGGVRSPSLISSGSGTTGLSAPLSGDVILPGPAEHGHVVLIDRGSAVLSWVDPATARVTAQLSVATGFYSNPQDYVQVAPDHAYVPRFEGNAHAGRQRFDAGNDVLVIDPAVPRIVSRIDLMPAMKGEDPKYLPRANRAVVAGGQLYVLLSGYTADFSDSAPSRVARIDTRTDRIDGVLVLKDLHGCAAMALSPSGDTLAVSCSGMFEHSSNSTIAGSGVVLVRLGSQMSLGAHFRAADLGHGPLAFGVAWAGSHTLLVSSFGRFADASGPAQQDSLMTLDTRTGAHRVLLHTSAFALGEVRCIPDKVCFAADAGGGVVDRFDVDAGGQPGSARTFHTGSGLGLPPRYLGWFIAGN